MAFPVIESTNVSSTDTAGTNHVVALPSGIVAGDLILILMVIGSTAATLNAHGSYTELLDENSAVGLKVLYRWATGGESNPTLVSSASTRSAEITLRISGAADPATQLPELGSTATGSSVNPNPPSLDPAGEKDFLFIAFCGSAGEQANDGTYCSAFPTNYNLANLQRTCGTVGTNLGGMIAAAARQLNTAGAEDPGTFTVSENNTWRTQTIAVHRAPVVATKTGSGVLSLSGQGHPPYTKSKAGIAILGVKAPIVAGSGVLPLSGTSADDLMYVEAGSGISPRVGSGASSKVGGDVAKTGAGVSDRVGAATDAVLFIDPGSGVLDRTGTAADELIYPETGAGVSPRSAVAADELVYADTGTGVLSLVGSGASQTAAGGTTYTKAGFGRLGSGAVISQKTGAGAVTLVGSGSDQTTDIETGAGVLARVGSGVAEKAGAASKTGAGVSARVGSGDQTNIYVETSDGYEVEPPFLEGDNPPQLGHIGSGVSQKIAGGASNDKTGAGVRGHVGQAADAVLFVDSGAGISSRSAAGADAQTAAETGVGILNAVGSGSSARLGEVSKTGAGVRGHTGTAADTVIFTDTAAGALTRIGSATDTIAWAETGSGILNAVGSAVGSRGADYVKTGAGLSVRTTSGFDSLAYGEFGSGVAPKSGGGLDAVLYVDMGTGALTGQASGAKFMLGTAIPPITKRTLRATVANGKTGHLIGSGRTHTQGETGKTGVI